MPHVLAASVRKTLLPFLSLALTATLGLQSGCKSPPVASISVQQSNAALGAVVSLSGDQSMDNLGEPLSFAWRFDSVPAGSKASLFAADQVHSWFMPDVAGTYSIQLKVADKELESVPVSATVTAGPCGGNVPTVMGISANPTSPGLGGPVSLSATVSDGDNAGMCNLNQTLAYAWSWVSVPTGAAPQLNNASLLSPSFVPQVAGTYVVGLVVHDSTGLASPLSTQSFQVTAAPVCGQNPPVALLPASNPVAGNCQAGGGGNCTVSATLTGTAPAYTINAVPNMQGRFDIQLDASASTDADNATPCNLNQPISYKWEILAAPFQGSWSWQNSGGGGGSSVTQSTLVNPTLRLSSGGNYQLRLTVSDGQFTSAPILVTIKT